MWQSLKDFWHKITHVEKLRDYQPGDQISQEEAVEDFFHQFKRVLSENPWHWSTGLWVDLVRIAGVSDRDKSQEIGRALSTLSWVVLVAIVWIAW